MKTKFASAAALVTALAAGHAMAQNCHWDFTTPTFSATHGTIDGFLTYQGELVTWGSNIRPDQGFPNNVARWTGSGWTDVFFPGFDPGQNTRNFNGYVIADNGTDIYFAGPFRDAGGIGARGVAHWDGSSWHAVGGSPWSGGIVSGITLWDDGNGEALYVGGGFSDTQGPGTRLVKWDGVSWSQVGVGMGHWVTELLEFQGDLYIIGSFSELGDETPTTRGMVRWDGSQFHPVGTSGLGTSGDAVSGGIVWDDGNGEAIYVYGSFTQADGVTVNGLARWDGTSYSDVAGGLTQADGSAAWVGALGIFDDGTGDALFVGSRSTSFFTYAGGLLAERLAKWDGSQWHSVTPDVPNHNIMGLYQFDDPITGNHVLWVGGQFTEIGGTPASRLSRWVCDAPPPTVCYADCNGDDLLNIADFLCFIDEFAVAQTLSPSQQQTHYANCTGATSEPFLTVADFLCFIDEFAQGCP